jgi:hypothetical protein
MGGLKDHEGGSFWFGQNGRSGLAGSFDSFFNSVRVKIQCKNPLKMHKIHLIMFTPEGYEQVEDTSNGGSDKGGVMIRRVKKT